MTKEQKQYAVQLRAEGFSFGKIAEELGVPASTVKSFYIRNRSGQQIGLTAIRGYACKQ